MKLHEEEGQCLLACLPALHLLMQLQVVIVTIVMDILLVAVAVTEITLLQLQS